MVDEVSNDGFVTVSTIFPGGFGSSVQRVCLIDYFETRVAIVTVSTMARRLGSIL